MLLLHNATTAEQARTQDFHPGGLRGPVYRYVRSLCFNKFDFICTCIVYIYITAASYTQIWNNHSADDYGVITQKVLESFRNIHSFFVLRVWGGPLIPPPGTPLDSNYWKYQAYRVYNDSIQRLHQARTFQSLPCRTVKFRNSFISGLKPSFSANNSHRSLPFLFPDWLHGFPGLFTATSEHIRFFRFYFFLFSTFYTVSQKKTRHQTLGHNFTNYYRIFKIFSLADSVVNLQQTHV